MKSDAKLNFHEMSRWQGQKDFSLIIQTEVSKIHLQILVTL